MQNITTTDNELLSILIKYPELFENTIVKEEYLIPKAKKLFSVLKQDYEKHKCFLPENLIKYSDFDISYFSDLLTEVVFESRKDIRFKELEKLLIERYKQNKYKELISKYKGDYNKLYNELSKVNEINYNENEKLTVKKMVDILTKKNTKINLGYPVLDYNLNLSQNDLLIIAGGTSAGKTAFALNLLTKLSKEYQCIYFNMEMGESIIYRRILSIMTELELKDFKDIESLEKEKKIKIHNAMKELESRDITLVSKSLNIKEIITDISNIQTDKHIIVFVDHIGLIKGRSNASRYEVMTEIAKELRAISLTKDCTVIGLSQLNREAQRGKDKPMLQDLRDSGEIEQSARKVLLLHNLTDNPTVRVREVEVIIAKNDDGNIGSYQFRFDKYNQKFEEVYNKN